MTSCWCMPIHRQRRWLATETKAARAAADKLLAAVTAQLIVPPQLHVYTRAEPGDAVSVPRSPQTEPRCWCWVGTGCRGLSGC